MPKTVGFKDKTVTSGFDDDKENQYRAKQGRTDIVRFMTEPVEYLVHKINDVLDPDEDGEERAFSLKCAQDWDEAEDDWVGDCEACEQEYDRQSRYAVGMLVVARKSKSGKTIKVDANESVKYWDYAATTYSRMETLTESVEEGGKEIRKVEVKITCEDTGWQKVNLTRYEGKQCTKREHVTAWKEEGPEILEKATTPSDNASIKRRLKKKKKTRDDYEEEPEEEEEDLGLEEDEEEEEEEEERPKRKKKASKKTSKKATKKKATKKKATKKKTKKKDEEEEEEDEPLDEDDVDGMIDELGL